MRHKISRPVNLHKIRWMFIIGTPSQKLSSAPSTEGSQLHNPSRFFSSLDALNCTAFRSLDPLQLHIFLADFSKSLLRQPSFKAHKICFQASFIQHLLSISLQLSQKHENLCPFRYGAALLTGSCGSSFPPCATTKTSRYLQARSRSDL